MNKIKKITETNISIKPLYAFILLAAIFVTALIIRLSPVIQTPETFRNGFGPYGDTYLYHVLAYNLYKGNGFSGTDKGQAFGFKVDEKPKYEPAIVRGPVYPFFLSMVYRIFCSEKDMQYLEVWHKNWDKVRIAQCLLDAIVCILVFFISRVISKKSFIPALISSVLYCFSFYNIFYTRALLSESVTTFLLTASLLFCVLGLKHDKSYLWGLAGSLFGLVMLSSPEYLLFPVTLMLYMIFINRKHTLNAVKKFLVFIITATIVVIPWTVRNYHVFKQFIPVSVGALGVNLFLGTFESNNNWQSWEELPDNAFNSKEEKAIDQSLFSSYLLSFKTGRINVKDVDNSLKNLALKRIQKHPFECLKRWIIRIPRLWYQFYVPLYRDKEASGGFFIFYFIFALCALWKGAKEERALMAPLCLLFIYLTFILLPFHIEPRFGVSLMPGIICMASIGIWKILPWSLRSAL